MSRMVIRGFLISAIVASTAGAQDSIAHRTCRDPHPAPVCGGYFLFEYNAAARVAGTQVTDAIRTRDALRSWFTWDVGWMSNRSPSRSLGASVAIGGSADGARVALLARHRSWLSRDVVVDASAGPLMAMIQNGGQEGMTETHGATAAVGVGRARIGLLTVGMDVARQRGATQRAMHVGLRTESRGAALVSAVAAIGGLIVIAGLSSGGGY